jgi:hypothetical protein
MIWIIVVESIIILVLAWLLMDSQKAIRTLIGMWAEEKNKQWLDSLVKSGAEIIKID